MGMDWADYEREAAWDAMYEEIGKELYPDHKDQAIEEFTHGRLYSYYQKESMVMRPAVDMIQEANRLRANKHFSAAVAFYVSAIELLLKATVLKPLVAGLVHNERLADIIVSHTLAGTGYDRYKKLLSQLFEELASLDLGLVTREGATKPLLEESTDLQSLRNGVIHRGEKSTEAEAQLASEVAVAVFAALVQPMLHALGLTVVERGEIRVAEEVYGKL